MDQSLIQLNNGELIDVEELFKEHVYNYDEISKSKYTLALCEPYNNIIHGDSCLNNHYLVNYRFKNLNLTIFKLLKNDLLRSISKHTNIEHSMIRNYKFILNKLKPEIVECVILSNGECTCILKTFWIRIIQRSWKNLIIKRNNIINLMKNPKAILHRQTHGFWGPEIDPLPQLAGMLKTI